MKKQTRDVTKTYPIKQFIAKIKRLVEGLEKDTPFTIQIAGHKIRVPKHAVVNIEHEKNKTSEEIEFQISWKLGS